MLALSFRADPVRTVLVLVLAPVTGAATSGYAIAAKILIDAVANRDTAGALRSSAVLAVTVVGLQLLGSQTARVKLSLQQRVGHQLDHDVLRLCAKSAQLADLERPEFHDRMEILRRNRPVAAGIISSLVENLRIVAQLVSIALLLTSLNHQLLALPLFAVPALCAGIVGQRIQQRADVASAEPSRRQRWLFQLATTAAPAKELRVFGLTDEIRRRFLAAQQQVNDLDQSARTKTALMDTAGWLIFSVGFLGSIALVLHQVTDRHAPPGDLVLLIVSGAQLDGMLTAAAQMLGWLRRASWAADHYLWLLDAVRPTDCPTPATFPITDGSELVLDRVSFSYPGANQATLSDISLRIPAGSTVALVGENGAGKSTLVKLLCRLYQPTYGSIRFGPADVGALDLITWQRRLALAFQDFCRFEFTVAEAVGVGDITRLHDRPAITTALARSGGAAVVAKLPTGLDSQLGSQHQGGTELSTGQWQRLALARTAMRQEPTLLILDEPTASLDPIAEQALYDAYFDRKSNMLARSPSTITVAISHRFGTVRLADLIIVLKDGRIIESGTHAQLQALGGEYAELFEKQSAGYRAHAALNS
ncbi:MAG: ABC transporter ATP-binding protein [Jatrophihabitans sp.]